MKPSALAAAAVKSVALQAVEGNPLAEMFVKAGRSGMGLGQLLKFIAAQVGGEVELYEAFMDIAPSRLQAEHLNVVFQNKLPDYAAAPLAEIIRRNCGHLAHMRDILTDRSLVMAFSELTGKPATPAALACNACGALSLFAWGNPGSTWCCKGCGIVNINCKELT